MKYIGVDACKKGWFAVCLESDERWAIEIFDSKTPGKRSRRTSDGNRVRQNSLLIILICKPNKTRGKK